MAFLTHSSNELVYHTSDILENSGIVHGFSTRLGGVSKGHFASLNLQKNGPEPDGWENVLENYRRFCEALGTDVRNVVRSKQVHEDTVRHVTEADRGKGLFAARDYTADALVTNEPGLNLMVFSADCIILLLHDPLTRSIGAVHAGWRGRALWPSARASAPAASKPTTTCRTLCAAPSAAAWRTTSGPEGRSGLWNSREATPGGCGKQGSVRSISTSAPTARPVTPTSIGATAWLEPNGAFKGR